VDVKADPRETPVSCAKRLNDFRGLVYSRGSNIPKLFFSQHNALRLLLCHTLNLLPATFSQAWIQTTLWELASQNIYDETYGYIFRNSLFLQNFGKILFNSELHFSINVDSLSTPLTKTDYSCDLLQ
jgi:hypothetical protein